MRRLRSASRWCTRSSTPTAFSAERLDGITEVRAGVYVFFDLVMPNVGVCRMDGDEPIAGYLLASTNQEHGIVCCNERVVPPASASTVEELVRVLTYPKFRLSAAEEEELLADLLPWVEAVRIPDPPPSVPACRDPFDLPFLHLAVAGHARAIVSGDRDLLALDGTRGLCPILSVDTFCRQFLGT